MQVHASYQPAASISSNQQRRARLLWRWVEALECFDGFDGFDCFDCFEPRFGLTFSKAGGRQPTHRSGPFRVISSRRSPGGDRHKLHTMLQPSSKVSKGPTQDPLPPVPFAASFAPIHFAQPRDTLRHTPSTLPSLALRPCDPATLRDPAIPPPPRTTDYDHHPHHPLGLLQPSPS